MIKNNQKIKLVDMLVEKNILNSKKEAVRLIQQGAVSMNQSRIDDTFAVISPEDGDWIKIGKRRYYKFRIQS